MPRLSIEISDQEHQWLKATAALKGQSLKDYVLSRTLPGEEQEADEQQAVEELLTFLEPRIREAREGKTVEVARGTLSQHMKARASSS